jgi:hypothetical protein
MMTSDLSLTLTASLLFLILSSRFAYNFVRKTTGLTDDMSTIGRTVLFGLLLMASMRFL